MATRGGARPPQRLVADRRVSDRAFRMWCWLDHLCRARKGPVKVSYAGLAAAFGVDYAVAQRAMRLLDELGYVHRESLGRGREFTYLTIDDPLG